MTATRTPTPLHPSADSAMPAPAGPVSIDGIRALLQGLDRRQRQAVTHADGPLLVVAGPGTGKTEVITRRVAWLIASRRARPADILALTFTERAADEMQARVDLLVPYGQADTSVHTFHAFGDQLLREHGFEIGRPSDPQVIGRSAAIALLRENVFALGLDRYRPLGDPTRFVGALVDLFIRAKEEGLAPADLAAFATELAAGAKAAADVIGTGDAEDALGGLLDEAAGYAELATAYAAYQELLAERALVDHGDQVAESVRLLQERASVRMALRRRFRYVVVDEAQDANPQQLRLVRELVGSDGNVMFVGDDDQAIYSFRGAVGDGLTQLEAHYPGLKDVVLRRNYRSRAPILDASRRLIQNNGEDRLEVKRGLDKTLTAVRRSRRPASVGHRVFATTIEEADHVASDIRRRLEAGASPSTMAVLVRTNADAAPVLASLDAQGIPRHFSGVSGLLSHRDVRDLLSLLRVITEPGRSEDLYALMTANPYGLAGADLTAICELAHRKRRSLWSVVTELVEQPGILRVSPDTRSRLVRLVADLGRSIEMAHERPAPAVLYEHLRGCGWLAALVAAAEQGDDGPVRRAARLFEMVKEQADLMADARAVNVVPALDALIDAGHDPAAPQEDAGEGVSVLTVHQSKGLEFATVYVIGLCEGRFPIRPRRDKLALPAALTGHAPSGDPVAHLAEERRLFYVAMTRARDELVLSHAAAGKRGGRFRRPSVFLAEALGHDVEDGADAVSNDLFDMPMETETSEPASVESGTVSPSSASLDLSFTQIDDYLSCPLKYKLRHQVRVPTPPNHALVFGSAMHQAVASVNQARMRGEAVEANAAQETLDTHWRSEGFLSEAHERARHSSGQAAVQTFVDHAQRDASDTIVAVEQPFSVRIGGDRIRGRYDAIRQTPDGTIITDYKSGDVRDPVKARQRARSSLQLQLYALAHTADSGTAPEAVELHFLEGDVVGRVTPTERQLDRAREKVTTAADGIRSKQFDATPGYPACDWCPYQRICPAST
jgi:DNA helicase-2/ATP-dependent DNA helicase PcrA